MVDFKAIYAEQAAAYQRMIAHEDYQGHLFLALDRLCMLSGIDVVEFGAGTGRLTVMLAPLVRRILAFDISTHMLETAVTRLRAGGWTNWLAGIADNARLPVAANCADLAIEGWSFGHLTGWYPESWHGEIDRVVNEMCRVVRPGGMAIILETLGTGYEQPQPPTDELAVFYHLLEVKYGFKSEWIRTDYQFESPEQAAENTRFFFGDELADRLIAKQQSILPECTGIWWRIV